MKTLWLRHDYRESTLKLEGQFPAPSHFDQPLHEDTEVYAPDGNLTAVLLCNVIPAPLHKLAFELWKTVRELPSNRGTAVGSPSRPRIKSDGTPGKRHAVSREVLKVLARQGAAQGTLGFLDQPCHRTPLSIHHPEMLDGNRPLIELVDVR
jgi:hypothetical protein